MIVRLSGLFLYTMLVLFLGACSTETMSELPVGSAREVSYVAAIGKEASRTFYTEDIGNNDRPYLKAFWGSSDRQTEETISLYTEYGTFCGDLSATIAQGGSSEAKFVGILKDDVSIPAKAYYCKNRSVTSLKTALDLTAQSQAESGSTAHLSGQDFMVGTVTTTSDDEAMMKTGSITFQHLTAIVKYILTFPAVEETETNTQPELTDTESSGEGVEESPSLSIKTLLLKQTDEGSVLKLKQSLDGTSVSETYPELKLSFKENNGMVTVPDNNLLETYVSIFPSSTKDKYFTLIAQASKALYASNGFVINQNLEAGKLYTIATNMKHLKQYDWYFNPVQAEDGTLVYTLTTGDELAAFSKIVNGEAGLDAPDNFAGKTVKLETEEGRDTLSLEGYQPWEPIGKTLNTPFKGTFDGNGKTITNLKTDPNKDYQGLFGFVDGATIKNLTIEGEVLGQNYVGAVAAHAVNSTFEDCTFGNPNMSNFYVKGLNWIGGILGYAKGSVIESCVNNGEIYGGPNGYVGGLGGGSQDSTLRGCMNNGGIFVDAGGRGGGLMGLMNGGYISGCVNHGEMTSVAGQIAAILANIAGEMANQVNIIGSYSDADNGSDVYGFGTGDYIVNGSYYTGGKGDDEWYRSSLTKEEYDAMNELINGEGLKFDENGYPINVDPTDFSDGNVDNFGGGGYLE